MMQTCGQPYQNKKNGNFVSISSLTGKSAAQKIKKFAVVILRSQNKITDFSMILAWDSPFKINLNFSNGNLKDIVKMFSELGVWSCQV